MGIGEAVGAMKNGKTVKRRGQDEGLIIRNNKICKHHGFFFLEVNLSTEDILADDWEIVN